MSADWERRERTPEDVVETAAAAAAIEAWGEKFIDGLKPDEVRRRLANTRHLHHSILMVDDSGAHYIIEVEIRIGERQPSKGRQ